MKLLKQSIACFVAVFVISGAVLAGTTTITGTAFVTLGDVEASTLSDGGNLSEYTNSGVWVLEGMPEGFPSKMAADCVGSTVYSAEWAKQKGLFSQVFETADELDAAILTFATNLCTYNPEAMAEMKKVFWADTENWDRLLAERASISGRLVLSEFTKETLKKFK